MAKLIYDNSAMKHDTPDNSLQHWKYIRRERVGDKWKYFYKDDENDKGENGKKFTNTFEAKKVTVRKIVAEQKKKDAEKAAYKKSVEIRSQSAQDKRKAIGGAKLESERTAHEEKLNKASLEKRINAGKKIINEAKVKDEKAEAVQKTKAAIDQVKQKAKETAKQNAEKAAAKQKAEEKQKQWEENVRKSMTDRKNAKLNEKKAAYNEAKAKRDAEAEGMRKAAKEKATEFAKKFLENRKTEAERKREEMRKRRRIQ